MSDELYMNRETLELYKLISINGNNVHLSKLTNYNLCIDDNQSIYIHLSYFKVQYFTTSTSNIINIILHLLNNHN